MLGSTGESIQEFSARILALDEYGPLLVTTRNPDIARLCQRLPNVEGISSIDALPGDKDRRTKVIIGTAALVIDESEGDGLVSLGVVAKGSNEGRLSLPLEDVEAIKIDHRFGKNMPLNGRKIPTLSIYNQGGMFVPGWTNQLMKGSCSAVVESGIHPDNPGVGLVRTYEIARAESPRPGQVPTIEEAKAQEGHSMAFLISPGWRLGDTGDANHLYRIVTSCMGGESERPLTVRPPWYPRRIPLMHVEMLDLPSGTSQTDLLARHLKRMANLNPEYRDGRLFKLGQMTVDATFLHIVSD